VTTTVVFVELANKTPRRASLEALSAASAGGTVVAVLTGPGAVEAGAGLGRYGAARAVCLTGPDGYSPDGTARDCAALVQSLGARAFLASATATGRDLLPRVAALLDCTPICDCTALTWAPAPSAVRPVLAGKALTATSGGGPVFCASLRPNCFALRETSLTCAVESRPAQTDRKAVVVEVAAKPGAKLDVQEAPVVVSGGRGLRGPENFHLLESLAAAFGNAAVGASRAVVDAGWRPHGEQVGQTGKTVAPQLYVAVGISGAIQHLAGMRTSKVIVAINKDPAAPIFKVADYGIVGDAFEVVPALTEAVKQAKG
jgi:electron transfer flavoprotein alpha subunit